MAMQITRTFRRLLGGEQNIPIEFHDAPQTVLSQKLGKFTKATAEVTVLRHGTCNGGQPASFVVFKFKFKGQNDIIDRLTKVTVRVSFRAVPFGESTSTGTASKLLAAPAQPEVHRFCPGILDGKATEVNTCE